MKKVLLIFIFLLHFQILTVAQPRSIAVSELTAQGVQASDAAVISEQLRFELMKSPEITLVERSQMQEVLKEQGFQQTGCTSEACAVEIGQLLGVKNIVVGTVGKAGSYTLLSARIIDVATGQVIVNESVRTKGGIDNMLEKGIQTVSRTMLAKLFPENAPVVAPKKNTAAKSAPLSKKTTRNILLIGGGAVLAGGGIVAAVLLSNNGPDKPIEPGPNTRIDLP